MTEKQEFYWYAYRDTAFLTAISNDMNAANNAPYNIGLQPDELWDIAAELNKIVNINGFDLTTFEWMNIIAHVSEKVAGTGYIADRAKAGSPPPPPPPYNPIGCKRQVPYP